MKNLTLRSIRESLDKFVRLLLIGASLLAILWSLTHDGSGDHDENVNIFFRH